MMIARVLQISPIPLVVLLGMAISGPVSADGSAAANQECHTFHDYMELDDFWSNWFGYRDDPFHVVHPISAADITDGGDYRDDGTVRATGYPHTTLLPGHTLESGEHGPCRQT